MKKQLYVAATAATLASLAPHLVQAEQVVPSADVQLEDSLGVNKVLAGAVDSQLNRSAHVVSPSIPTVQPLGQVSPADQGAENKVQEEQAQLEAAKKQAIAAVSQMQDLPSSLKNTYLAKLQQATTLQEIEAVKQEVAQYVAQRQQLEAKKAAAKETLTKKEYLFPGQRSDYLARLEQLGTEAEIDGLLAEADQMSTANKAIFQKRDAIDKGIDQLRYLSQEQKADFKGPLEALQSDKELDAIFLAAKKANIQALKDREKEALTKAKAILKGIKQLPEVTDESLYKGQMEVWQAVGSYLDGYLHVFDSLNPETDAHLTNQELKGRLVRLYDALQYGEMEYIARDLEQKRKQYPDNQELRNLLRDMFYDSYASVATGSRDASFVGFINRDIYPRQKRFNELYRILSGTPLIPLTPAQPIPKKEEPAPSDKPKITARLETREEQLDFQTITRENPNLPKGEKRVITKGEKGVRTIVEEVQVRGNDILSRKVISDVVTKPAIDEVVEIGTKEADEKMMDTPTPPNKDEESVPQQNEPSAELVKPGQNQNKDRRILPRTNDTPSILSAVGIALVSLTGLFIKKRKK
ncbi:hypothetical protein BVE84_04995 [Streptococcus azizii]|uniref:Gram-positive cocci surface proteins LPxTG domain-containing protein n=1 Tax=Streptococcus azizii TaxID=1579424 RepID=A0AB36JPB2_9STRE|nr:MULTISPECIES: G5 domain-containing protein [Streptococcus]MBF0775864.1 G5 domain-containing protein [Streptococcus sp. 19428wD3_AN2]ONK27446.1 hypothetical protein BVE86_04835 [Streptococcus azizii]ONK28683.1 hypothetical protein BVE85_04140 [Streptococcus azizii]ONK29379.1 hypothetical protein BVE84_04995 [Streptococcus azizii]TFU83913.1 LPXTG cell wall anchor domain-containing protein [Streptococcus sp. AN2]